MTVTIAVGELEVLVKRLVAEALEEAATPRAADEFLSTADAARHAGVAMGTVRRWIRQERLATHRAGRQLRVRRSDLDALLRAPRGADPQCFRARELTPEELADRDPR